MSEVLVLHASLCGGASTAAVTALLDALPYAYRLALERRDAPDRIASLTAIALLLEAVRRVRGQPADPSRLRVPPGGKPTLDGGPRFSIAHSTARAAVAVCEHSELGLDLEEQGAGGRTARELERWVATEAVLKAVGAGLRQAPAVRLDDDLGAACFGALRLRLSTLAIAGNCVARLASHDELSRVTVEEIDWPA
jgi:hypothetical protein